MATLDDLEHDDAGRIVGAYRFAHCDPAFVGYLGAAYFEDGVSAWMQGPQLREVVLEHGAVLDVQRRDEHEEPYT